jgi:Fe-S cluster assembly iron-binding protein IscA
MKGSTVDFVKEGLKQAFKIENPNVEASCGCGESVSFKNQ